MGFGFDPIEVFDKKKVHLSRSSCGISLAAVLEYVLSTDCSLGKGGNDDDGDDDEQWHSHAILFSP